MFAFAFPAALVLVFFGESLLEAVYGVGFSKGHFALGVLALGHVASAWFGSVAYLLNMTGHERDTARGAIVGATSNLLLNLLLIPPFGIEGAAVATAGSVLIWNALLHRKARSRLQLDSSVLGRGVGLQRAGD